MRKVLFKNPWLTVVELDDWFIATEPTQSKGNRAVAVLPYREVSAPPNATSWQHRNEFLARFELNPAHMTGLSHQTSIITGACETGNPLHHAKAELLEEGGYDIPEDRFVFLGIVSPIKTSCTKLHLYAVQIYLGDKQVPAQGDGGVHDRKEYAEWVSKDTMIAAKDPYIHTIIMRAKL